MFQFFYLPGIHGGVVAACSGVTATKGLFNVFFGDLEWDGGGGMGGRGGSRELKKGRRRGDSQSVKEGEVEGAIKGGDEGRRGGGEEGTYLGDRLVVETVPLSVGERPAVTERTLN